MKNFFLYFALILLCSCSKSKTVTSKLQIITTIAGNGKAGYSGDGSPATAAELNYPRGVTLDKNGNIYIGDQANNRIRKISSTGIISTIAGNGLAGFNGDGISATLASINGACCIAIDNDGNIYIADVANNRIRRISHSNGIINTIAGTGIPGYSGDDSIATDAKLNAPTGIALDNLGNIYFADDNNNIVRKISIDGIISTIAGNRTSGYSGDGNVATLAQLAYPRCVAVDNDQNIYIADENNSCIREVNHANGVINTIAGNGTAGYKGDGAVATAAELNFPTRIAIDNGGNIYIADAGNNRIRIISASGVIRTIAGKGGNGYNGDNKAATAVLLNNPAGIAVDSYGNIYIADENNNRIRKINH